MHGPVSVGPHQVTMSLFELCAAQHTPHVTHRTTYNTSDTDRQTHTDTNTDTQRHRDTHRDMHTQTHTETEREQKTRETRVPARTSHILFGTKNEFAYVPVRDK